jgi:hypothetical protein
MRQPSSRPSDSKAWNKGDSKATTTANEADPLLQASAPSYQDSRQINRTDGKDSSIRSRRRSPAVSSSQHFGSTEYQQHGQMNTALAARSDAQQQPYEYMKDEPIHSGNASLSSTSRSQGPAPQSSSTGRPTPSRRLQYQERRQGDDLNSPDHPPLLEIPEEIYGVRKSALQVLKPLTKTWVRR